MFPILLVAYVESGRYEPNFTFTKNMATLVVIEKTFEMMPSREIFHAYTLTHQGYRKIKRCLIVSSLRQSLRIIADHFAFAIAEGHMALDEDNIIFNPGFGGLFEDTIKDDDFERLLELVFDRDENHRLAVFGNDLFYF